MKDRKERMNLPEIKTEEMLDFLTQLLKIPSPTGFTDRAIGFCEGVLATIPGVSLKRTHKGALLATLPGESDLPWRGLTAHVDTLGAMVKEIKSDGRLKLTKLGGFPWNTVEGEGVSVFTQGGKTIRGSILINKASTHVHGQDVSKTERNDDTMEVRLDERTVSADETTKLGISVGDFVAFDPRVEALSGMDTRYTKMINVRHVVLPAL